MIAVFTADFKDEEDGKNHPNRIPTPDMPSNEDDIEEKKEKKKGSRRKHKHRSKGNQSYQLQLTSRVKKITKFCTGMYNF